MADYPAAPFYSADDLTGRPGDPSLSGIGADFDPANKNPLGALQQTFDRVDTESNQAIEAAKQRQFQAQQAAQKMKNDILLKHMEYDHEDKINQNQQALKNRQIMFNMFNQTGGTAATIKDEQGNDAGIGFLPQDQQQLSQDSKNLQDWVYQDPNKNLYSSDFTSKNAELKQKRINASMRSYYVKLAQQQAQSTFDPAERQRLLDYASKVQSEPITKMPDPYMQQPTVKPIIDVEKDYKDGKGLESFDDGNGVPNARYVGLANTTDPQLINEGFKRYQFFKKLPEGQSAEAYANWKQSLDKLTAQRGLPPVEIPASVTPDGKVVFDDNTYAKQQKIARSMLTATELMNNGYLKKDEDAESDAAKLDLDKARAAELWAKVKAIKEGKPVSVKSISPKEQRMAESSMNTVKQAVDIFNPERYIREREKNNPGRQILPPTETVVKGKGLFSRDKTQVEEHTIDGVNVYASLKDKGFDPTDYVVYKAPDGVEEGVGKQKMEQTFTADGKSVKKVTKTGENEPVDKAFVLFNPKTNDVRLAYYQKGDSGHKLLNIVSGKEYVANVPNANHQWGLKDATNLATEKEMNENLWNQMRPAAKSAQSAPPPKSSQFTPKLSGQPVQVRVNGGAKEALVDGVWRKIKGIHRSTGEIEVE